jgi:hypothetical protein
MNRPEDLQIDLVTHVLLCTFPPKPIESSVFIDNRDGLSKQEFDATGIEGRTWIEVTERSELNETVLWGLTQEGLLTLFPAYLRYLCRAKFSNLLTDYILVRVVELFETSQPRKPTPFSQPQLYTLITCFESMRWYYDNVDDSDAIPAVRKCDQIIYVIQQHLVEERARAT